MLREIVEDAGETSYLGAVAAANKYLTPATTISFFERETNFLRSLKWLFIFKESCGYPRIPYHCGKTLGRHHILHSALYLEHAVAVG